MLEPTTTSGPSLRRPPAPSPTTSGAVSDDDPRTSPPSSTALREAAGGGEPRRAMCSTVPSRTSLRSVEFSATRATTTSMLASPRGSDLSPHASGPRHGGCSECVSPDEGGRSPEETGDAARSRPRGCGTDASSTMFASTPANRTAAHRPGPPGARKRVPPARLRANDDTADSRSTNDSKSPARTHGLVSASRMCTHRLCSRATIGRRSPTPTLGTNPRPSIACALPCPRRRPIHRRPRAAVCTTCWSCLAPSEAREPARSDGVKTNDLLAGVRPGSPPRQFVDGYHRVDRADDRLVPSEEPVVGLLWTGVWSPVRIQRRIRVRIPVYRDPRRIRAWVVPHGVPLRN